MPNSPLFIGLSAIVGIGHWETRCTGSLSITQLLTVAPSGIRHGPKHTKIAENFFYAASADGGWAIAARSTSLWCVWPLSGYQTAHILVPFARARQGANRIEVRMHNLTTFAAPKTGEKKEKIT